MVYLMSWSPLLGYRTPAQMKVRGVVLLSSCVNTANTPGPRAFCCAVVVFVLVSLQSVVGPVQVVKIVNLLIMLGMAYNSSIRHLSVGCRRSWLSKVVEMVVGMVVDGCCSWLLCSPELLRIAGFRCIPRATGTFQSNHLNNFSTSHLALELDTDLII